MKKGKSFEIASAEDVVRRVTSWVTDIILVALLAFSLSWAFGSRITMDGGSMSPLLSGGEKVCINRLKGKLLPIERFDIAAYSAGDEGTIYIKLVLALPGETIQIKDGKVYIDQELLSDERLTFSIPNAGIAEEPVILGEGEYFVIGRSTNASRESRFAEVGNIRLDQFIGTVWLRYSPFSHFGLIKEQTADQEAS